MDELERYYIKQRPTWERLLEEVSCQVTWSLREQPFIETEEPTGRVKELWSLRRKLRRRGLAAETAEAVERVSDLVGVRVVCMFRSDVSRVVERLSEAFEVVETDDKIGRMRDSPTGYQSCHLIVHLRNPWAAERYRGLQDMPCEIQIRTLNMHAWAVVSHYLAYKREVDIPEELQEDFRALAGLFHVADSAFEALARRVGQWRADQVEAARQNPEELLSQQTDVDSLLAYLALRASDREQPKRSDVGEWADFLAEYWPTIRDVDAAVEADQVSWWSVGDALDGLLNVLAMSP